MLEWTSAQFTRNIKVVVMKFISRVVALFALLTVTQVNAALITKSLDALVAEGVAVGTFGTVTVVYDDALLTAGSETRLESNDFSITLDLFSQIFVNSDDVDFDIGYPEITFDGFKLISIDLRIFETALVGNPTAIDDVRIGSIMKIDSDDILHGDLADTWRVVTTGAVVPQIPEPNVVITFALALSLLFVRRQLKK